MNNKCMNFFKFFSKNKIHSQEDINNARFLYPRNDNCTNLFKNYLNKGKYSSINNGEKNNEIKQEKNNKKYNKICKNKKK